MKENETSASGGKMPVRNEGSWIFIISIIILFVGSIGMFCWLIIDAVKEGQTQRILLGSSFLIITSGVLVYAVGVYRYPKLSRCILWLTVLAGIAVYITGLSIG